MWFLGSILFMYLVLHLCFHLQVWTTLMLPYQLTSYDGVCRQQISKGMEGHDSCTYYCTLPITVFILLKVFIFYCFKTINRGGFIFFLYPLNCAFQSPFRRVAWSAPLSPWFRVWHNTDSPKAGPSRYICAFILKWTEIPELHTDMISI